MKAHIAGASGFISSPTAVPSLEREDEIIGLHILEGCRHYGENYFVFTSIGSVDRVVAKMAFSDLQSIEPQRTHCAAA